MAVQTISGRITLSDPKPAFCSACAKAAQADVRFFDFSAAFDAGAFIDPQSLTYVEGSDDLHLCEDCVREVAQVAGFKPELHARQFQTIKELEAENEHLRSSLRRMAGELQAQVDASLAPRVASRRKVGDGE